MLSGRTLVTRPSSRTGWGSSLLSGLLWMMFMLISTHFLFGVAWLVGTIFWSVTGLLFAMAVQAYGLRRGPLD